MNTLKLQPGNNFITNHDDIVVAEMHRHLPDNEVNALAATMAAAPDLLEALKSLLDDLPSATAHPAIQQAKAAIRKAVPDET